MCVFLVTQLLWLLAKFVIGLDPVNRLNHTSWVAVNTQTDSLKSVRNRYVIEVVSCVLRCQVACRIFLFV